MSLGTAKPSFEALYEAYYDRIYRYAYTILLNRENAEDVVGDTFMAAYIAYDRFDPSRASPGTWLTRIAHNKTVNLVKSASHRRETDLPEGEDRIDPAGDFTARVEDGDTVLWLYARLTHAEREFLDLRYVMELTDAEVGALLNFPVKTVNKRYQRLLEKCRGLLSGGR